MKSILDTSLFFIEYPLGGEIFTTPSVVSELLDLRSKCRYETLLATGLQVLGCSDLNRARVQETALRTGDAERLSSTDIDVLALALDLSGTILSDDFAIQNVALALAVPVQPVQQRKAKRRKWRYRCTGCERPCTGPGTCPVCGSQIKRTIK
jgi:UPF0271 protein